MNVVPISHTSHSHQPLYLYSKKGQGEELALSLAE